MLATGMRQRSKVCARAVPSPRCRAGGPAPAMQPRHGLQEGSALSRYSLPPTAWLAARMLIIEGQPVTVRTPQRLQGSETQ